MRVLNPYNLRCLFCGRKFCWDDLVAIINGPDGRPCATHIDHVGVRELVTDPMQLTTGAILQSSADSFVEERSVEDAIAVLERQTRAPRGVRAPATHVDEVLAVAWASWEKWDEEEWKRELAWGQNAAE